MGDCNIGRLQPFGFIILRDGDFFLLFVPRYDWYPYQSDVESFTCLDGTTRRGDSNQILFELRRIRRVEPVISPLTVSTCGWTLAEMRRAARGILVAARGVLRFYTFLPQPSICTCSHRIRSERRDIPGTGFAMPRRGIGHRSGGPPWPELRRIYTIYGPECVL